MPQTKRMTNLVDSQERALPNCRGRPAANGGPAIHPLDVRSRQVGGGVPEPVSALGWL
ncbi:MAG: hypothetical protein H6655_00765 [Ardenticatenaceae bacterium]|nr:hypothetical protein [Ardenticatenaceae bacterium]